MKNQSLKVSNGIQRLSRKLNILIVEDDQTSRILLRGLLSKMGLNIKQLYEANNGKEGLQVLKNMGADLILTDVNMPVMNGLEMLKRIREYPVFMDIPSVVVTSEKDDNTVNNIIQNGYGYVHKPFTLESLEHEIINLNLMTNGEYV